MRKLLTVLGFTFILFMFTFSANAQDTADWTGIYGGTGNDIVYDIEKTSDGGSIMAGSTASNDGDVSLTYGNEDYWIVKLDSYGNIEWEYSYGGSGTDVAYDVEQTADGGYIVAGKSNSTDGFPAGQPYQGGYDAWILKLQGNGTLYWQTMVGGSGEDSAAAVEQTSDNGYIVAGHSYSNDGFVNGGYLYSNFWLIKIDEWGNIEWNDTYGGSGEDFATDVEIDSDGGFIITGYSDSTDNDISTTTAGGYDLWTVKTDNMGSILWDYMFGEAENDYSYDVEIVSDGGYIIAGSSAYSDSGSLGNKGSSDMLLVKLSSSGEHEWSGVYGGSEFERAYDVEETPEGRFIAAGYTNSTDGDIQGITRSLDCWVVSVDEHGNLSGGFTFGGESDDQCTSFFMETPGKYIYAGTSKSSTFVYQPGIGAIDAFAKKITHIYKLTFDENLGNQVQDISGPYGTVIDSLPTPERPGCVFLGWYSDEYFTSIMTAPIVLNDYETLYAKWKRIDNQGSYTEWTLNNGGSDSDVFFAVEGTSDGGAIAVGRTESNDIDIIMNHGMYDMWVVKYSHDGTVEWQRTYGGSSSDSAHDIKQTPDGGYIIAGSSSSGDGDFTAAQGLDDFCLLKIDAAGNIQWQNSYGGSQQDIASSIALTADGGYVMAGSSSSDDGDTSGNHGPSDYWVVKTDSAGNLQWQGNYGGSSFDTASAVMQLSSGNYIVAGTSKSIDGQVTNGDESGDFWVILLDESGNLLLETSYGDKGYDEATDVLETGDGDIVIVGSKYFNSENIIPTYGDSDIWVIKTASDGSVIWGKNYGGTMGDFGTAAVLDNHGNIIVTGFSYSDDVDIFESLGEIDACTIKVSPDGTLLGQVTAGGSLSEIATDVALLTDGKFIVAGYSSSNDIDFSSNFGILDGFVQKFQWKHTIGFIEYGGTDVSDISGAAGSVITDSPASVREGYVLEGWYHDSLYMTEAVFPYVIEGNRTLHAKWLRTDTGNSDIIFSEAFGGSSTDGFYSVVENNDGTFLSVGATMSDDGDISYLRLPLWADAWIVKSDASGNIIWQKTYGGMGTDIFQDVTKTPDNGFIAVGQSRSSDGDLTENKGSSDFWIVKIDSTGNILWQKSFGGTGTDSATSVSAAPDGNYIVIGFSDSNDYDVSGNNGNKDFWVLKIDPAGNLLWQKSIGTFNDEIPTDSVIDPEGNIVIVGTTDRISFSEITALQDSIVVWKLNSEGESINSMIYGSRHNDHGHDISMASDGDYLIAGSTYDPFADTYNYNIDDDFIVLKLNPDLSEVWTHKFIGSGEDVATGIEQTDEGVYLISGYSDSTDEMFTGNLGEHDIWVLEINDSGTILNKANFGGRMNDYSSDFILTEANGFAIAGYSYSNDCDIESSNGLADSYLLNASLVYIVTFDSNGGSVINGGAVAGGTVLPALPQPVKPGYEFSGWYLDSGFTLGPVSSHTVNGSAVFHAKWEKEDFYSLEIEDAYMQGGSRDDVINDIEKTTDSGYIIGGVSLSDNGDLSHNNGSGDYLIYKTDSSGEIQWLFNYGGSAMDNLTDIEQTSDGGYIAAGYSYSDDFDVSGSHGLSDIWIVRLNASGGLMWSKAMGGTGEDYAYDIEQTADDGFMVVGRTGSNNMDISDNYGFDDCWVIKLNQSGNIEWERNYGGYNFDGAEAVEIRDNGNIIIAGYSKSKSYDVPINHGSFDVWLAELTPAGDIIWQKSYGGTGNEKAFDIEIAADDGIVIAGYSDSADIDVSENRGSEDFWLLKVDASGNILWENSLGGSLSDIAYDLEIFDDGRILITGNSFSNDMDISGNYGGSDIMIALYYDNGVLIASENLGGPMNDAAYSVVTISEESFITAGMAAGYYSGADTYTVEAGFWFEHNYNENGGSFTENTMIAAGKQNGTLPEIDKPGFEFSSWCSDIDLTQPVSNIDVPSENLDLYAKWNASSDGKLTAQWTNIFGGSSNEDIKDMVLLEDGGIVSVGYTQSDDRDFMTNHGGRDALVVKTDSLGNIVWQKSLGGSMDDEAMAIEATADGAFIVAGYTESDDGDVLTSIGNRDMWILKLDANGAILWQKTLGSMVDETVGDVDISADGSIFLAGSTSSFTDDFLTSNGGYDSVIIKMDSDANVIWKHHFGGSSDDFARDMELSENGSIYILSETKSDDGDVSSYHGGSDFWLTKLNSDGIIEDDWVLGGSDDDIPSSMAILDNGNIAMAGKTSSSDGHVASNNGNYDAWVITINSAGIIVWSKTYGDVLGDTILDLEAEGSDFYTAGYTMNGIYSNNWIMKFNSHGNLLWQDEIGGIMHDGGFTIKAKDGGNLVIGGFYGYYDESSQVAVGQSAFSNQTSDCILTEAQVNSVISLYTGVGNLFEEIGYPAGTIIESLPEASREDAFFDGWYEEANLLDEIILPFTLMNDVSMYAAWNIGVAFDERGGSSVDDLLIRSGSTIENLPVTRRNGYTFLGWYTFNGVEIRLEAPFRLYGNIEIYAKWRAQSVIVPPVITPPDENDDPSEEPEIINVKPEDVEKKKNEKEDSGSQKQLDYDASDSDTDSVIFELLGTTLREISESDIGLGLKTRFASLHLEITEEDISSLLTQLGISDEKLSEVTVRILIKKSDVDTKGKSIVHPVDITFTALYETDQRETAEVSFDTFERFIRIYFDLPEEFWNDAFLTGAVINKDGSFSHIPTRIIKETDNMQIVLSSLTNSTYLVISNHVEVESVIDHWSQETINNMASRMVIENMAEFAPDEPITRGRFAEYITKALGLYRSDSYASIFTDVDGDDDFSDAISIAATHEIINGYPDGTFRADSLITREEAMLMFARAMQLMDISPFNDSVLAKFKDADDISEWAYEGVDTVTRFGVFNGRAADELAPGGIITHAEAGQAIQNLLKASGLID